MYYQSKIIVGIYSYLQDHTNKDIEDLFSNGVDLFNALGSWIYGGASIKIVFPELQLFVRKANSATTESFSDLLEYINWVSYSLFKILKDNELIENHYYESFTLKQSDDITTGMLFMWRLGWLIVRMKDISKENKTTNLSQSLNILESLFDAIGGWIYNQEGLTKIAQIIKEFEKPPGIELNMEYKQIIEEALKTYHNIIKFLQKLKNSKV